jgi:ketosteroid isomerase-like protein
MLRIAVTSVVFALVFLSLAENRQELRTPEEVVQHHWRAFRNHDLEAVLSDYAEDAVFIAPNQTVQGKAALGRMFAKYFSNLATPSFDVSITADGDVGYEHWVSNAGKPGTRRYRCIRGAPRADTFPRRGGCTGRRRATVARL